jgi:hypothetical protein
MVVAAVLAVLGVIGGIFLMVIGLLLVGNEYDRPFGIALIAAGLSGILIWVFIGSIAQTLAAGVKVLAVSAQKQRL